MTAPNVSPRTSCFWLNHPKTIIGIIAITEAAESLAQNKPSGLENDAIKLEIHRMMDSRAEQGLDAKPSEEQRKGFFNDMRYCF